MKRVAILQSNYIPWKGYFDIIRKVDLFVFYDDVQYTKNDWRNRNMIATAKGPQWLTIPCGTDLNRLVCEVRADKAPWRRKHWASIEQNYRKAPHWDYFAPYLRDFYGREWEYLSDLNQTFIRDVSRNVLGFGTEFGDSRDYGLSGAKGDRVLDLLKQTGATHYLSGPAAKSYIDESAFEREGIALEWMDYSGYPEYDQRFAPFSHNVSIVDLIFCCGPDAPDYIRRETAP